MAQRDYGPIPYDLFTDPRFLELDLEARGMLLSILAVCSYRGRFPAHPNVLAARVSLPLGVGTRPMSVLESVGFVRTWEGTTPAGRCVEVGEVIGYHDFDGLPRDRKRPDKWPETPDFPGPGADPSNPGTHPAIPGNAPTEGSRERPSGTVPGISGTHPANPGTEAGARGSSVQERGLTPPGRARQGAREDASNGRRQDKDQGPGYVRAQDIPDHLHRLSCEWAGRAAEELEATPNRYNPGVIGRTTLERAARACALDDPEAFERTAQAMLAHPPGAWAIDKRKPATVLEQGMRRWRKEHPVLPGYLQDLGGGKM